MRLMGIVALVPRPARATRSGAQDLFLSAARRGDYGAQSCLGDRHQCAAASGVGDEGRSLAIGLQEQVATAVSGVVKSPGRERHGKGARGVRCGMGIGWSGQTDARRRECGAGQRPR